MCGFAVVRKQGDESKLARRGPDHTFTTKMGDFIFSHYLLHITGECTPQPFVDGDILCVYNGEIYNHTFVKSDGENIIPLYRKHGYRFAEHLDGEWAIAIYDFKQNIVLFSTDPFGTKPLWTKGSECASYESALPGSRKLPPNTTRMVSMDGPKTDKYNPHIWNFKHQDQDHFEGWITAFLAAVGKRMDPKMFIGLSSGYDTGGIACALKILNLPHKAYSVLGMEDPEVLQARGGEIIDSSPAQLKKVKAYILENAEPWVGRWQIHGKSKTYSIKRDPASVGLGLVCQAAQADNKKVYLSGQGGDEILSDYSLIPAWSQYKGRWPNDLNEWTNFCGSHQQCFINKEEYIAGAYGIEARYPYLDAGVVQEFLYLTPELKNKEYKAPLAEFLRRNNYPNVYDKKIGFKL